MCCNKIAEAEAAVSVNKKKWLVMHMHVQLQLDEPRGPPKPLAHCDMKVPGRLLPFCWAGCCIKAPLKPSVLGHAGGSFKVVSVCKHRAYMC